MHSPSPWGRKQSISDRQVLSFPLGKEAIHHRQAVRQALSFPLGKEAVLPRQLFTFLPGKETVPPRQLLTFLLGKEAILPWQLLTFLLGKEAILCWQLLTFLPEKEAVPPRLLLIFPLGKQAVLPRQLLTFPLGKVTVLPSQPLILRQGKQAIKLGQTGRALGILPGIGHPRLPRRIALPPRQTALTPRKATPPLPSPVGFPQGSSNEEPNPKWVINLSSKPLTPAQRSVLAKGPNFVVSPRQPPNLEYVTAIEVACTKLSQQDAEET